MNRTNATQPSRMPITLRDAQVDDIEHIRWALFTALAWKPEGELLVREVTIEHPEIVRYHRDWGRRGDSGVIACVEEEVAGVAYYRTFSEEDRGYGYVDAGTPEMAVAVALERRGQGIGSLLLMDLADKARLEGFARLSLSVSAENPARRLYERLGYREISRDGRAVRMVLDL